MLALYSLWILLLIFDLMKKYYNKKNTAFLNYSLGFGIIDNMYILSSDHRGFMSCQILGTDWFLQFKLMLRSHLSNLWLRIYSLKQHWTTRATNWNGIIKLGVLWWQRCARCAQLPVVVLRSRPFKVWWTYWPIRVDSTGRQCMHSQLLLGVDFGPAASSFRTSPRTTMAFPSGCTESDMDRW